MKKLIIVADWIADMLARQEVRSAVEGFVKEPSPPNIAFVGCTSSDLHASYQVAQLVETEERYGRPLETVIYQNVDPGLDSGSTAADAKGARFVTARLKSGLYVCGPNTGCCYTMIKGRIDAFFVYDNLESSSRFHSRDLYPRILANFIAEKETELDFDELSLAAIPEYEGYFLGHIDSYGNLKTNITHEDTKGKYQKGDKIRLSVGGQEGEAIYTDTLSMLSAGQLGLYPGTLGRRDNPYMELTLRRDSVDNTRTAATFFSNAKPGSKIEFIR